MSHILRVPKKWQAININNINQSIPRSICNTESYDEYFNCYTSYADVSVIMHLIPKYIEKSYFFDLGKLNSDLVS